MKGNEAILAMMEHRGYRAPDVADKLHVSPQAVRYYVNGQPVKGELRPTSATVDTMVDLAAAMDFELVLLPKRESRKLPDGALKVDERVTERKGKRRADAGKGGAR